MSVFLRSGLTLLACAALLPAASVAQPLAPEAAGTIADVRHVVVFVQENRSFDHYFGTLAGVRGFADGSAITLSTGRSVFFQPASGSYVLPFHSDIQCMIGTLHDWDSGHKAWNGGRWDQWIAAKSERTMAFLDRRELPYYYALADAYTVLDGYYSSVIGPSNPNRLYIFTGMLDPDRTGGGPVTTNVQPPEGFTWTTYAERLQAAGVSWKVYQESDNFDDNALAWFRQFKEARPGTPLYERGMRKSADVIADFQADVASGALPAVSWVLSPGRFTEHPPYAPASGEWFTQRLLGALASNPAVANTTVFILTYDENDGFFDHVVPPVPPQGTGQEFVSGEPIGLGARVPAIIVSPWTRGGYVNSQTFDHTSLLRFLERWTGVVEPNISAWRRQVSGDLTSAFDFAHPDFSRPVLPTSTPVNCGDGVHAVMPGVQVPPVQEAGVKPSRSVPYRPEAGFRATCDGGLFAIRMTNFGSESVHFAVHANRFRSDAPADYDVVAGGSAEHSSSVDAGRRYDVSAYGPDGFLRQFAGDLGASCGRFEATAAVESNGSVTIEFSNATSSPVTFTVTANAFRRGGPWTYVVAGGSRRFETWQPAPGGRYDFTITADGDSLFVRRMAGRAEVSSLRRRRATRR